MTGGMALAIAAPAAAGDIYSWRTEDGGYAFADDIAGVPERYRDQVVVRQSASISDYGRYTAEDDAAASRYQEQLAARLTRLRGLNAPAPQGAAAAVAAPGRAPDYVTVRSGSRRGGGGVDFSTPVSTSDAPLEVETLYMRRNGSLLIQPVRITRRGDKIVSIVKSRNRNWSLGDVIDEADLDALLEE